MYFKEPPGLTLTIKSYLYLSLINTQDYGEVLSRFSIQDFQGLGFLARTAAGCRIVQAGRRFRAES